MSSVPWLFLIFGTLTPVFDSIPLTAFLRKIRWGIENGDTSQRGVWLVKAFMGVAVADIVSMVLAFISFFMFHAPMIHRTLGVTVILVGLIIGIFNIYAVRPPVAREPGDDKFFRDLRRVILVSVFAFSVIGLLLFLVL